MKPKKEKSSVRVESDVHKEIAHESIDTGRDIYKLIRESWGFYKKHRDLQKLLGSDEFLPAKTEDFFSAYKQFLDKLKASGEEPPALFRMVLDKKDRLDIQMLDQAQIDAEEAINTGEIHCPACQSTLVVGPGFKAEILKKSTTGVKKTPDSGTIPTRESEIHEKLDYILEYSAEEVANLIRVNIEVFARGAQRERVHAADADQPVASDTGRNRRPDSDAPTPRKARKLAKRGGAADRIETPVGRKP